MEISILAQLINCAIIMFYFVYKLKLIIPYLRCLWETTENVTDRDSDSIGWSNNQLLFPLAN